MSFIRIENVSKHYKGVPALRGVNLAFDQGCLTAVLGPSGCGKTTLLRALAGFIGVDAGEIIFGGQKVTYLPPQARGTAMFFQNYALWPHMSVYDNIAYGLRQKKLPEATVRTKVADILRLVELDDAGDMTKRKPPQFSGGQQQRIALARALVVEPRVLLLDEPLSNLDAKVRHNLRIEIRQLQKRLGITAVYVTHDQEEALSIADHVVVMNKGSVMQAGTPAEVYGQPQNLFMADFLGKGNLLTGRVTGGVLYLGNCRLGTLAAPAADADVRLIIRSTDVAICLACEAAPPATGEAVLDGTVSETLFGGAAAQHLVQVEGQSLFAEAGRCLPPGPARLTVPKAKIMVFADEKRLEIQ